MVVVSCSPAEKHLAHYMRMAFAVKILRALESWSGSWYYRENFKPLSEIGKSMEEYRDHHQ